MKNISDVLYSDHKSEKAEVLILNVMKSKGIKMKNLIPLVLSLIFALLALNAHSNSNQEAILEHKLRTLNLENPKQDLTKNIGRDDFRFIGLYGYAQYFPGTNENDYPLINKYGISMIEGTSDLIESEKHKELIRKAKQYAEIYNSALLNRVKEHNVKPQEGYVPDKETAIKIAVAIWIPIYGQNEIEKQKPYNAILENGIWFVSGSLPKGWVGGVAEAEILKENGKIIRISHGK